MKNKIENDFILKDIRDNFNEEIYLVGGSVRDFLSNKTSNDRDLLVLNTDVKSFSKKVAQHFNATFIELDATNEIYRLVLKDKINYIDITKPVDNSIETDLKLRDLTINSLAVNIKTGDIIDVTNGKTDFENKKLRIFNEQSIIDDPLRLLRVFRFLAIYGFKIEQNTKNLIKKHKSLIAHPAIERKNYEILKMFEGEYTHNALLEMDECNLLEELFPFINDYKKVPPNSHHHLDLFHHVIETVNQIQQQFSNANEEIQTHLLSTDLGTHSRLGLLKFAGFLHDIGKFSTWTIEENGRHRFIKHDDIGAKIAKNFLTTNKFSKKQTSYISEMIKYHIYPSNVVSAPDLNDKIMMRFVRKMENNAIDIITLAKADRLSAQGVDITEEIIKNNLNSLDILQKFYVNKKDTLNLEKLLSGEEIMDILKIKPSPLLGKIIKDLTEAQINSEIITKNDAIIFVKNYKF